MPNKLLKAETVKDFMEGSPDAFKTVYKHYHDRICELAKQGLKDSPLADLYIEKFFLYIWMYRGEIGKPHYFDTYLWMTAKHLLRMYRKRMAREYLSNKEHLEASTADEENDLGRYLCEEHIRKEFYRELDRLPPRQKKIFILATEDYLSVPHIAQLLNIDPQTVHNQLSRARIALRASFALQQDDLETWDQD